MPYKNDLKTLVKNAHFENNIIRELCERERCSPRVKSGIFGMQPKGVGSWATLIMSGALEDRGCGHSSVQVSALGPHSAIVTQNPRATVKISHQK